MAELNDDVARRIAWDTYFASVTSISLHPGAGKDLGDGAAPMRSVKECAAIADEMLAERDARWGVPAQRGSLGAYR